MSIWIAWERDEPISVVCSRTATRSRQVVRGLTPERLYVSAETGSRRSTSRSELLKYVRCDSCDRVRRRSQAEDLRLQRRSTAARVSEMLRDSISRGELPPGTPLREIALSEALDVSRNTVREALRLVDHEGLVDYHVHRGVTVRRLRTDDLADLYRTREVLQLAALRYSTTADPDTLQAISDVVTDAESAAAAGDRSTVATLDIVFHQKIVELVGGERVNEFFRRIAAELRIVFAAFEPSDHGRFVSWNRLLADLILAGRVDECAQELREYLATAEHILANALDHPPTVRREARADAGAPAAPST